jgi:hypothetical protein
MVVWIEAQPNKFFILSISWIKYLDSAGMSFFLVGNDVHVLFIYFEFFGHFLTQKIGEILVSLTNNLTNLSIYGKILANFFNIIFLKKKPRSLLDE